MKWDWPWDWPWDWVGGLAPYLPPALGSLIALRWAKGQTPRQKVLSFCLSFALAVYLGPAIAEVFALGPKATVAVGILTAIVGMDVIGGLMVAVGQFQRDPAGTFRAWLNAWLGRSQ